MRLWRKDSRYLRRLQAPYLEHEALHLERALGWARIALSLLAILAVFADSTEPPLYSRAVAWMVAGWFGYSAIAQVLLLRAERFTTRAVLLLHIGDIFWPAVLTCFSLGPSSPLFVAFTFVVVGAAFRWGYRETMLTAIFSMLVLLGQSVVMQGSISPFSELRSFEYEINRLIIRLAFLIVTGFLIGSLGESVKERRAESLFITRLLRSLRMERSIRENIGVIFDGCRQLYHPREILFCVEETSSGRCYLWRGATAGAGPVGVTMREGDANSCHVLRGYPKTFFRLGDGRVQPLRRVDDGEASGCLPASARLLSTGLHFGDEWSMRLYLLDPRVGFSEQEMLMLEHLLQQSSAAIYNIYLARRIRSRSGVIERARVARALHDGAIQSLISIEMRLSVQRRGLPSPVDEDLRETQMLLHQEVLNLRDLMQQLRPLRVSSDQLLDCLAEQVDRFRRDSGLQASFVADDVEDSLAFSPHLCRTLVRILQEALVNVRKHSGAKSVIVGFQRRGGRWRLSVADDGRGADFAGRIESGDNAFDPRLPAVIRERCRAIDAHLVVQSSKGLGYQTEVTLPAGI